VAPGSLIGQGLQQQLGEQNFEMLHPQIEQALCGQRATSELYMSFGKRQRYVEVTCVPQHDEEGNVDGFMMVMCDVTARKQLELRLQREANQDVLTGLPNRRNFIDLLALAMLRTQRIGSPLALVLLDLDAFKAIHDAHGRDAGDAVLLAVAQRLRRCVRRTDTVARLGSERFVVLLECMAGAADAVHVIKKIRAALAQPVDLPDGVPVCVAASMCSVAYTGNRGVGAEMLLSQADAALYEPGQGAHAPRQTPIENELV
jgi:diguanylate cyclase (GGDEF)-like protein